MKRVSLLCAIAAAAFIIPSAKADTFNFSFNGGPLGYSGSGIFDATGSGGVFTIDSVLSGTVTDPFLGTSSIVSISTFGGADNLLAFPGDGTYFDDDGFSFNLADGLSVNLFYDGFDEGALRSDGDVELVTDSVSTTPEPSSFVLMGSAAVLGMGELLRRRRSAA